VDSGQGRQYYNDRVLSEWLMIVFARPGRCVCEGDNLNAPSIQHLNGLQVNEDLPDCEQFILLNSNT
jgi:hypothetical protein